MPQWKIPELPPGPLRDLNRALHKLHSDAGCPSARDLQQAVGGKDVVSYTKIHDALSKPVLPQWGVIDLLVEKLAERARPRVDPTEMVNHFKGLWNAANGVRKEELSNPSHQPTQTAETTGKSNLGSSQPGSAAFDADRSIDEDPDFLADLLRPSESDVPQLIYYKQVPTQPPHRIEPDTQEAHGQELGEQRDPDPAPSGRPDPEDESEFRLRQAAENGYTPAAADLGLILSRKPGREDEAIDWLRQAADNGLIEAQYELGMLLARRSGA